MIPLYDYQKEAVEAMLSGRVLNTSHIGIGKTLMALGCIEQLEAKTNMVVAPKSLLAQWEEEINKFMPDYAPLVISGTPKKRQEKYKLFSELQPKKILIVGYETLRIDMGIIAKTVWDTVIFDEAHKLKEPNTLLKKSLKLLIAHHRFGLSGSPVVNHFGNTYNILNALVPDKFPNYYAFVATFTIKTMAKGLLIFKDQDKIVKMFSPYIVSKTLEDAGGSLPELQEIDIPIELSDRERSIYNKMLMELIFEFEDGDVTKLRSPMVLQNLLAKVGKLQEVTDHLLLVGDHDESSKMDALKEVLENNIGENEKAILFTRFSRMAEMIHKKFPSHLITGQTNDRADVLKDFKARGKLLVMTNAGREGLNIQEANVIIMYDQDFTASGMEQRIGRAWRRGQTQRVRVYHLMAKKTIDYTRRRQNIRKRGLAEELQGVVDKESLLELLS